MSPPLDRRAFLAAVPAAGVVAANGLRAGGRTADRSPAALEHVGVQLYTVRSLMQADADRTLAELAAIGYRQVELAGLHGLSAGEMRERLDRAGLRAVSSHVSLAEIRGDWDRTLEGARVLGQRLIVCPSIGRDERDADGLARVADDFNRAGDAARSAGLEFGYHNHDWEFADTAEGGGGRSGRAGARGGRDRAAGGQRHAGGGPRPMDVLLERRDRDLVAWQMDVFWVVHGGADPLALVEAHPGRVTSLHVKDRTADGEMVDVGEGVINYGRILARASELGASHAFVEHDRPADPIGSVRASRRHLAALGY